jgi:hypothetical protein
MPKVVKGRKFRGAASLKTPQQLPSAKNESPTTAERKAGRFIEKVETQSDSIVADQSLQEQSVSNQPALITEKTKGQESIVQGTEGKIPPSSKENQPLSRGQRKRQAKREKYLRRERLVLDSLKLKRQEEQSKRIDGLDAIKEALLATVREGDAQKESTSKPAVRSLLKSNRGQKHLVEKEVSHMKLVLQHPAFQAEPFAAIREHLKNTIGVAAKSSPPTATTPKDADSKVKRKRRKTKYRATRSKRR